MKLKEIIDSLKYGELINISWDNANRLPQIITQINLGLLNLYTRFPILEKSVAIRQFPQISLYHLTKEYARSNEDSNQTIRYILDTPFEPFEEDILQITGATDEFGLPVPLNDDNNPNSWFIPAYNQLQIPNAKLGDTAFLIYKAKPKYIDPKTTDFDQDVYLPQILLDPLLNYVTYKIYLGLGGENAQLAQGYQQLYEKLCNDVAINNLLNDHSTVTNIKFIIRGFV